MSLLILCLLERSRITNSSLPAEPGGGGGGGGTSVAYWPVSAPASLCQHQCQPHLVSE